MQFRLSILKSCDLLFSLEFCSFLAYLRNRSNWERLHLVRTDQTLLLVQRQLCGQNDVLAILGMSFKRLKNNYRILFETEWPIVFHCIICILHQKLSGFIFWIEQAVMDKTFFNKAIYALACYVYAYSQEYEGQVEIDHYSSNGFDVAPDILERLGLMRSFDIGQKSWFVIDWTPAIELKLPNCPEDLFVEEIEIALVTAMRWGHKEGTTPFVEIQEPDFPELHEPGMHFYPFAMWQIVSCLNELRLGEWLEDNFFTLNKNGDDVLNYREYWTVQSLRKGVIDAGKFKKKTELIHPTILKLIPK